MNNTLGVSPSKGKHGTTRSRQRKNILTSVGIEPTTSALDLPLICRLSYKVAQRSCVPLLSLRRDSPSKMVPCFPLLGLTPSGFFMGLSSTIIYTSELILCSTICVSSATQHNVPDIQGNHNDIQAKLNDILLTGEILSVTRVWYRLTGVQRFTTISLNHHVYHQFHWYAIPESVTSDIDENWSLPWLYFAICERSTWNT